MKPPTADAHDARSQLGGLLDNLQQGLLERETASRLVLLAALAGEHALLIGPPGTAKSELARRLHRCFEGARYFERLLTRFSTPEELFGPLSLKALEDDRYERLVDGFLPTAGIAFLDEVFKANSAILNALLTLLNEREFDNGSGRAQVPLVSVVAASNEVPVDEALHAFYDRFLVRIPVDPVGDDRFLALLQLPAAATMAPAAGLVARQLAAWRDAALQVRLSEELLSDCLALRSWLQQQSASLSDRRWRQWMDLMRVAAATEGRTEADRIDLWLAPFVASPTPQLAAPIAQWFESECLRAVPQQAPWLTRAVEAFEKQHEIESTASPQDGEDTAGKMALARAISGGSAAEGPLRIVSATLEEQLRRRYSPAHVAARLEQIDELLAQTRVRREAVAAEAASLAQRLEGRLWLPPALARRWQAAHDQTLGTLDALIARWIAVRAAFATLPQDAALPSSAPEPLQLAEAD
jgi:MoxR-like ATPase